MEAMEIVLIIIGAVFALLGFLVKEGKMYNLIAGYNTMTSVQKAKVDIEKIATLLRNGFVLMGILTIVGVFVGRVMGNPAIGWGVMIVVVLVGTFYLVAAAQKFKK